MNGNPDSLIVVGNEDMDVYAVWEQKYKVTFHANNDKAYFEEGYWDDTDEWKTKEVNQREQYFLKDEEIYRWSYEPRTRENTIIFKGWSTKENATEPDKEIIVGTSDMDLYAVWAPAAKVTLNANKTDDSIYFSVFDPKTGDYIQSDKDEIYIEVGNILYNRNYSPAYNWNKFYFLGWSTDPKATTAMGDIEITKDITLYGVWRNKYTVTLDANGGYFYYDEPDSTVISNVYNEGASITFASRVPYNADTDAGFEGWFDKKTGGTKYTETSKVTSDITLYAHWKKTESADLNEGTSTTAQNRINKVKYKFVPKETGLYVFNSADAKGFNPSVVLYDDSMNKLAENDNGSTQSNFLLVYNMEKGKTYYYTVSNAVNGAFNYKVMIEKAKEVKITYDANLTGAKVVAGGKEQGATYTKTIAAGFSETDGITAVASSDNKVFTGWSKDKSAEYGNYYPSVTEDTTFYAVWKDAVTVTFDANNKDAYFYVDDSKVKTTKEKYTVGRIINNYSIDEPDNDNENLRFLGWSTNSKATEPDEEIEVTADLKTIYAVWGEASGTSSEVVPLTLDKKETAKGSGRNETRFTFKAPEEGLYVFTSSDIKEGDPYGYVYDDDFWNSDYDSGEGDNFVVSARMSKNKTAYLNVRSEYSGDYEFSVRVFKAEQASVTFDLNTTTDKAYYYDYETRKKTTTYTTDTDSSYYVGGTLNSRHSPNYVDESRAIEGWSLKKDAKEPDDEIVLTKNTTLYAVWRDRVKITFDINNVTLSDAYLNYYDDSLGSTVYGKTRTNIFTKDNEIWYWDYAPTVLNKNKRFLGWSTDKNAKTVDYDNIKLDKNMTLYAIWSDAVTITYVANGGYFGNVGVITATVTDKGSNFYTNYTPQNTDPSKVFAGWSTKKDATKPDVTEDTVVNSDMEVYAVWQDGIKITVDANGGYFNLAYGEKAATTDVYVLPGTTVGDVPMYGYVRALNNDPYKADWGRRSLTKGGKEADGTTELTKATTLYVVWTDLVDVVFDANGGTISDEKSITEKWVKGTTTNISNSWQAKSSETGKVFAGWSLDKKNIVTTVTADKKITLYAIYRDGNKVTVMPADKNESFSGRVNATYIDEDNNTFIWPKNVPYSNMHLYVEPKDNYLPIGFSTSEQEKDLISDSWYPTKETTLYAIAVKGWYIRFYAGEGTFAVQDETAGYSVKYRNVEVREGNTINTVMETPIAPEGKAFKAWKRSDTGAEVSSADAAKIKPTKAITLTAVYEKAVAVTGVTLNKTTSALKVGGSETLKATVKPANASQAVSWSSSDTSVATVDVSGKVTAVKAGTAKIRATAAGGKYAECTVTVTANAVPVTGVTLNKTTLNLAPQSTETLTATVAPSNASNKNVTWATSNAAVATVANGTVTAVKAGTAIITVTTADGKKTAKCTVTVAGKAIPLTKLEVTPTSVASLATKKTQKLTLKFTPSNTTQKDVKWTSSDETIAKVDKNGVVTALRYGKVTITATSTANTKLSAKCTIQTRYYDVLGSGTKGQSDYKYWFTPVYWAADKAITKGYDNVYFGPEENCKREQMVTFLWRLAGSPKPKTSKMPLSDVKKGTYYYNAVLWAYEKGITKGYTTGKLKGKFGVGREVTREETVTFIYRLAGKPPVSNADLNKYSFKDIKKNAYYQKPIAWAAKKGITNGYSSGPNKGKFGVGFNVLRKDIVTFLYRYNSNK